MRGRWRRFFHTCGWTVPLLVVLLCSALLSGLLVLAAQHANASMRSGFWDANNAKQDALLVGSWAFTSAHSNIESLMVDLQQLNLDDNALLLVARSVSRSLALILPLLALLAALALSQHVSFPTTSYSTRSRAVARGILNLAIPLLMGLALVIESRILKVPLPVNQWSRVLVWLGFIAAYFAAFSFLGIWISRRTHHIKTAVWISLSLFVALFMIQSSRELIMRFDGSYLPPVPDLPTEVRLSLFRPSGTPSVTPDREEMVAEYLAAVDAYSESVYAVVQHRYNLERWWHVLSPQLSFLEVSGQLLQAELAGTVDVLYSSERGDKVPSLLALMSTIWQETAWLLLLCALAGWASRRPARKRSASS